MPTENPYPSVPLFAVPSALAADASAGTVVFNDPAGSWRYDGSRGVLGALHAFALQPIDRHVVASPILVSGLDSGLFDSRTGRFLRALPGETPRPDSPSVSADGIRVAYVTASKGLRIAFQQPYGNVDGRALVRDRLFSSTLIAPSGRTIAATGPSLADVAPSDAAFAGRGAGAPRDIWLVDVETGNARQIYCTADPCPAPLGQGSRSLQPLSWSPDERYLLVRAPSLAAGADFDGTPFFALELATGSLTDLGVAQNFFSWRTWVAAHTLVFVSGAGSNSVKRLRLWSPEDGARDITEADAVAISPSFSVLDSTVYFVLGSVALTHLASIDPQTGAVHQPPVDPTYADEAVRVSEDGRALLLLRRRVSDGQLELWRMAPDGTEARGLIRLSPPLAAADALRFGTPPSGYLFDRVAWSR